VKKHYSIFMGPRGGHAATFFVRAPTPLDAIKRFMEEEDGTLIFSADGSVVAPYGRNPIRYLHPLAYIEACHKTRGEWSIDELPDWVWEADYQEVFCGENTSDIEAYLDRCRPVLRQEVPRSRAPGFVWYLRSGVLVTFYRPHRPFQIEVLGRYLIEVSAGLPISPWKGDYDGLLEDLIIRRYGPGNQLCEVSRQAGKPPSSPGALKDP
jgi:hypothetical protein